MKTITWRVFAYYGRGRHNPAEFGAVAVVVQHTSAQAMRTEVVELSMRPDIGVIRIERVES